MKTEKNEIYKYLSGLMNNSEAEIFEKKLVENPVLKNEFDTLKMDLYNFKSDGNPELNEQYLANILPKARIKLEKKNSGFIFNKSVAFSSLMVALLIYLSFFYDMKSEFTLNFSQNELEEVATILDSTNDENLTDIIFYASELEVTDELITQIYLSDIEIDESQVINKDIDNYFNYEELSDTELNDLIDEFENKNIL